MIDRSLGDSRARFRVAITGGLTLLDAALGTRLIAQGLRLEVDDPCLWNLSHPGAVADLHRRDVVAGAQAVLTNTFGANRFWLGRTGHAVDQVVAINRAAVALARETVGPTRFVLGDIGPTAADGAAVAEQAAALIDAGVDALILETHRLDQAEAALRQLTAAGLRRVPVLVSLLDWPDPADAVVARLIHLGAAALGGNCQPNMSAALELAERLRLATQLPLIVKPSAGLPGGPIEPPGAFAAAVPRLLALGPILVGGCCGTDEAYVAALDAAWYDSSPDRRATGLRPR